MLKHSATSIREYIRLFPKDVQPRLLQLERIIRKAAPKAGEKISYGLATFTLEGNLVHFGAYKTHVGFYPGSAGVAAFKKVLGAYKTSKGTIQFPIDQPLPAALITRIVKFRAKQNLAKARMKKAKKAVKSK